RLYAGPRRSLERVNQVVVDLALRQREVDRLVLALGLSVLRRAQFVEERVELCRDRRNRVRGAYGDRCRKQGSQQESRPALHRLYPIMRRNARRLSASSAVSTPFGEEPSMTPRIPRPSPVSATTAWVGLAVAQKIVQTSGTSLMRARIL